MPEQPSPQPADTIEVRRDRVHGRLNVLQGVVEEAQIQNLRRLLDARPGRPPRLELQPGQMRALNERRTELQRTIEDAATLERVVTGLEQVLDHLEANRGRYANQRLALLLQVVNPQLNELLGPFLAHQEECDRLTGEIVGTLRQKMGLDATSEPALRRAVVEGPPLPPAEPDAALNERHGALTRQWQALLPVLSGALRVDRADAATLTAWREYDAAVQTFERDCREAGFRRFKADVGFPADMPQADLEAFTRDIFRPLPAPETCRDQALRRDAARFAQVQGAHRDLERTRLTLSGGSENMLRFSLPAAQRQEWVRNVINFMVQRGVYERKLLKQDTQMDRWLMYAGVVANELAEEAAEGVFRFGQRPLYLRNELLGGLTAAARERMATGWEQLVRTLGNRGVPVETMGRVLSFMNRMPLGPQFWSRLIVVESPLTVMLWGYFMYSAENKTKAFLQFGSFLAMSGASNQLLEFVGARLEQSAGFQAAMTAARTELTAAEAELATLRATNPALRTTPRLNAAIAREQSLLRLLRLPTHPAVKFALVLSAAIAFNEELDQLMTWVDRQIPDSRIKTDLTTAAGLFLGEPLFVYGGELTDALGVTRVDPQRDLMTYLGAETFNDNEDGRFDRMYHHTIDDWNARVDQVIAHEEAAGARRNPVLIALLRTHRITDTAAWGERQSVTLYYKAVGARQAEDGLAAAFIARGVIRERGELNGLSIATADTGERRNDRAVAYAFGTGEGSPGIRAIKDALGDRQRFPDNDPLRQQWREYEALLREIGKDVSVYRHVNVYRQADWLGDLSRLGAGGQATPPAVQRGMIEEIRLRAVRSNAIGPNAFRDLRPEQYGAFLAGAVRTEENLGMLTMLSNAQSDVFRDIRAGIDLRPGRAVTGAPEWTGGKREELFILMTTCDQAGRILPRAQFDTLMNDVRALVLRGDVATMDDIRTLRNRVTEAVLNHRMAGARMTPGTPELRRRFNAESIPFYVQGSYSGGLIIPGNGLGGDQRVDPVASLAGNISGSSERGGAFSDLRIFQADAAATGSMRLISFSCPGSDRAGWRVRVHSVRHDVFYVRTSAGTVTQSSIRPGETTTVSFADWLRANAPTGQAIEQDLARIQDGRRQSEQRLAAARAERTRTLERETDAVGRLSRNQTGVFIETSPVDRRGPYFWPKTFSMRYGDAVVTTSYDAPRSPYDHPRTGPAFVNPEEERRRPRFTEPWTTDFQNPYDGDAVAFTVERNGQRREIRVGSYADFTRLGQDDQRIFLDLLTTPLEGSDRALNRLIRLFPHQYHDGGSRDRHVSRDRLLYGLLPHYYRANGPAQKQRFLRDLWNDLAGRDPVGVYFGSVNAILEAYGTRDYGGRGPTLNVVSTNRQGSIGGRAVQEFGFSIPPNQDQLNRWRHHIYVRDELQTDIGQPPTADVPAPLRRDPVYGRRAQLLAERDRLQGRFAAHADSYETPAQDADERALAAYRQSLADYYRGIEDLRTAVRQFGERNERLRTEESRLRRDVERLWVARAPALVLEHVFRQITLLTFRRQLLDALETGRVPAVPAPDPVQLMRAWGLADAPFGTPLWQIAPAMQPLLNPLRQRAEALGAGQAAELTPSDREELLALYDETDRAYEATRAYDRQGRGELNPADASASYDVAALTRDASANDQTMTRITDRLKRGRGARFAEVEELRASTVWLADDVRALVDRTATLRAALPAAGGELTRTEARDREWGGRIPVGHDESDRRDAVTEDNRLFRYYGPPMLFTDGVADRDLAFLARMPEVPKVIGSRERLPLAAVHVRMTERDGEKVAVVNYLYGLPNGTSVLLQRAAVVRPNGTVEAAGLRRADIGRDTAERRVTDAWSRATAERQRTRATVETAALNYWSALRPLGTDRDGHQVYGVRYGLSRTDIRFVMVRYVGPDGEVVPPPGVLPPGAPPMRTRMQYVMIELNEWGGDMDGVGDVARRIMEGNPGPGGAPVRWNAMDVAGPDLRGLRTRARQPGQAHPDLLELSPNDRMTIFLNTLARPGVAPGSEEDGGETTDRVLESMFDTTRLAPGQLARIREMSRRVGRGNRHLFMQTLVEQLARNADDNGALDLDALQRTEENLRSQAGRGVFGQGADMPNFDNLDQPVNAPTPWPPTQWPPAGGVQGGPAGFPGQPQPFPGAPAGFPGQPGGQPGAFPGGPG